MKSLINRLYRCTTTKVDEQVRRLARSLILIAVSNPVCAYAARHGHVICWTSYL